MTPDQKQDAMQQVFDMLEYACGMNYGDYTVALQGGKIWLLSDNGDIALTVSEQISVKEKE